MDAPRRPRHITCLRLLACACSIPVLAGCGLLPVEDGPGRIRAVDVEDALPRAEPRSKYGNPSSYVVFGKRYHVMHDSKGYVARGTASWYGKKFHGRRTSSGETYDMYKMTAAHKELPLPTYVKVRNLDNVKEAVVRVNDRGPFHGDRIIDLSYAAAVKLGLDKTGTAPVEIHAIEPGKGLASRRTARRPPSNETVAAPATAEPLAPVLEARGSRPSRERPNRRGETLYIQAGAFSERDNATRVEKSIRSLGVGNVVVQRGGFGDPLYRIRIGPLPSLLSAGRILERLERIGIYDYLIVNDR